ncbi:glycosyltransferase family 2 protein [Brevifollis gellanilyticus]|uniref:Glycosyl transferase n=1 Tax=Brevifollis gellanilyticus TaxID=748831 RepID=A0A512M5K8_9BACT|nr:glycosyltransferase family A protein [Brevifollis gellanilyticus]GEP42006.1 glycosyl transferase [Brevifollis gellanilyticus]
MAGPFFTVYTPTYNRAHTLHRCYDSLKAQTNRDFEWLIVDDGSTDGTAELVAQWQAENLLPVIRYEPRPHGGAHRVHNHGLAVAHGQMMIKLDSDDGCVPQALERLRFHWESIPESERAGFSGVTGLCQDQDGKLVGCEFPNAPLDCTAAELDYIHHVHGEKWGFLRLDVLRQFPFPEDCTGNFIPESYVWSQVSQNHETRHVNEQLRIYWMDAPSLVHGRPDPSRNADGHRRMFGMVLNLEAKYVRVAPARLFRVAVQFSRFSLLHGTGLMQQWQSLRPGLPRLLWLLGLPLGAALFMRDKLRK